MSDSKTERAKPCLQVNRRVTSFQQALVLNVSTNYWQIIQMIFNRLHGSVLLYEPQPIQVGIGEW